MITATLKRQVTIKRIVIIAYVMTVLLIAGFARAADHEAMAVTKVEVDEANQVILVEGFRNNGCQRYVRPVLVNVDRRLRKVVMKIAAQVETSQICSQQVEGHFQLLVSVPNLKLDANVPYELEFLNSQGVTPVEVTYNGEAQVSSFSSVEMTGILIQEVNGFMIHTRKANFKIAPSFIDFSLHAGDEVDVSGHEIPFELMPVDGDNLNMTVNDDSPKSLVVTGIISHK